MAIERGFFSLAKALQSKTGDSAAAPAAAADSRSNRRLVSAEDCGRTKPQSWNETAKAFLTAASKTRTEAFQMSANAPHGCQSVTIRPWPKALDAAWNRETLREHSARGRSDARISRHCDGAIICAMAANMTAAAICWRHPSARSSISAGRRPEAAKAALYGCARNRRDRAP